MLFDELGKFLESVFEVVWSFVEFIANIVQIPFMYLFKGSPKTFLGWILQLGGVVIYICAMVLALLIVGSIVTKIAVWVMDNVYKLIYKKGKETKK